MALRPHDPDVRRWVLRLERVLRDVPAGVGLAGMDGDLLVVDLDAWDELDGDLTNWPQSGFSQAELCPTVRDPARAYRDSGGW